MSNSAGVYMRGTGQDAPECRSRRGSGWGLALVDAGEPNDGGDRGELGVHALVDAGEPGDGDRGGGPGRAAASDGPGAAVTITGAPSAGSYDRATEAATCPWLPLSSAIAADDGTGGFKLRSSNSPRSPPPTWSPSMYARCAMGVILADMHAFQAPVALPGILESPPGATRRYERKRRFLSRRLRLAHDVRELGKIGAPSIRVQREDVVRAIAELLSTSEVDVTEITVRIHV
jgi:hypothetical protein